MNTNTCDKCGVEEPSGDLIWISADDFQPTEKDKSNGWNEDKHERMVQKYDALCELCYCNEIRLN